jgi:hypothetical protein
MRYDRKWNFEKLEARDLLAADVAVLRGGEVISDSVAAEILAGTAAAAASLQGAAMDLKMLMTTAGNPVNYETPAGGLLGGVAKLNITHNSGSYLGTGVLLPTGRHILTAAHNVFDPVFGTLVLNLDAVFDSLPGSVSVITASVHNYNGNQLQTGDIAVLTLNQEIASSVQRYDIYRGTSEVGSVFDVAGYGSGGTGNQGAVTAGGTKRNGQNRYEALGQVLNGVDFASGSIASGIHLIYDFDNGLAANDAAGVRLGISNLGLGTSEVFTAPGDSGGPTLIGNRIAGITSVGYGYSGAPDVLPGFNASFGEMSIDTRVSTYATFVDQFINEAGAPKVLDVTLRGSAWAGGVNYAFSDLLAVGDQLRPIATQGVNTISIQFSEHVRMRNAGGVLADLDGSVLQLQQTVRPGGGGATNALVSSTGFSYDVSTHTATWTFGTLPDGKYAIHLAAGGISSPLSVVDTLGNDLDGEWTNDTAGTPDNFLDDPIKNFASMGNGIGGSTDSDGDGDEEFRFHFALLAGDYSGDGVVNATDASPLGDGNGDGLVNSADNTVRLANLNDFLPLRKIGGADFMDDDRVDGIDLTMWQNGFGGTAAGDTDGDGDSDGADFLFWQQMLGAFSSWAVGPPQATAASLVGLPPQVMNVIVSGSASTHSPYSFANVDGSGAQLKSVPVGGADTVSIIFSEDVNVSADSLIVVGLQSASLPGFVEFAYDAVTHMASWRFNGWRADNYLLALSDAVTDVDGNRLDGEWTNPASTLTVNAAVSEFPSGDGQAGGWFNFMMTLLPGDAQRNNFVSTADYNIWLANVNNPAFDTGARFVDGDMDGDGDVDQTDYDLGLVNWQVEYRNAWMLGDLNGDWIVDASDIAVIDQNAGITGATRAQGDLNGDGLVTMEDLDLAYAQFGRAISVVS